MPNSPRTAPDLLPPRVVLDTNVVLDLLVFGDARARPLHAALQAGHLQALATEATLFELADVLGRPFLAPWGVPAEQVLSTLRGWSPHMAAAGTSPVPPAPRCRDADDQKFIDLALAAGARWLFSHDRALLALAKRARLRGLDILTPQAWAASQGAALPTAVENLSPK
jgi:predicted nucleic acid-binding protein